MFIFLFRKHGNTLRGHRGQAINHCRAVFWGDTCAHTPALHALMAGLPTCGREASLVALWVATHAPWVATHVPSHPNPQGTPHAPCAARLPLRAVPWPWCCEELAVRGRVASPGPCGFVFPGSPAWVPRLPSRPITTSRCGARAAVLHSVWIKRHTCQLWAAA